METQALVAKPIRAVDLQPGRLLNKWHAKPYRESRLKATPLPIFKLRLLFLAGLSTLPLPLVRAFWRHVLGEGELKGERSLYAELWSGNNECSAWFYEKALLHWERFLMGHKIPVREASTGLDDAQIIGKMFGLDSTVITLQDFLYRLYHDDDIFRVVSEFFTSLLFRGYTGSIGWIVADRVHGGRREMELAFAPDSTFQSPIWYDSELFSDVELRNYPCWLGLPPAEKILVLSDCRRLEEVLWTGAWALESGVLSIGSERFGHVSSFLKEAETRGWDLGPGNPPDWPVVVVEKEYICPARNRIVLRPSQIFGAPFYIARVYYGSLTEAQSDSARKQLLLKTAEGFVQAKEPEASPLLQEKFRALMAVVASKSVFSFNCDQDALYIDGNRWMKGQAARILYAIFRDYTLNGRREFEFARFKNDSFVTQNSKRSNFELFLKRLTEKLQVSHLGIRLNMLGRGRFGLDTDREVEIELVTCVQD